MSRTRVVLAVFAVAVCFASCSKADRLADWPPAGNLVGDKTFIADAIASWDHPGYLPPGGGPKPRATFPSGTGKHRGDVHVLFAGVVGFGRLAILTGRDVYGHARIVAVIDDHQNMGKVPLVAANNVAATDLRHVPLIAIEHNQGVFHNGRFENNDYVVVLARKKSTTVRLTSKGRINNDTGSPIAGSIAPRSVALRQRMATSVFRRSRPIAATELPVTSMGFTGDELPEHLVVSASSPRAHDVPAIVLQSASCFACQ